MPEKIGLCAQLGQESHAETTLTQRKQKLFVQKSLACINDNTIIAQGSWSTTAGLDSSRWCSKNRKKAALICTQDEVICSYNKNKHTQ